MKQVDLREGARRQHRIISLFAVLQCWLRGLDGLCFDRHHLERLIGLEKFKSKRLKWLEKDIGEFFPYQELLTYSGTEKFASLYISRIEFELPDGSMSDEKRISLMSKEGPCFGMFLLWPIPQYYSGPRLRRGLASLLPIFSDRANYDERLMMSYLSLILQGHISPKTIIDSIEKERKKKKRKI